MQTTKDSTKTTDSETHMHRTQLFIPKELHGELVVEAQSQGVTLSELARQALSQYIHKQSRNRTENGTRILLDMAEGET